MALIEAGGDTEAERIAEQKRGEKIRLVYNENSSPASIYPVWSLKDKPQIPRINIPQTLQEIAGTTVDKIETYFSEEGQGDRWDYHKEFLAGYTLAFLDRVRAGFLANPQAVRNLSMVDNDARKASEEIGKEFREDEPDNDDNEAFSRFRIAQGMLPDIALSLGFPILPGRRQMFEAPFTRGEVIGRIYESEITIGEFKDRKIKTERAMLLSAPEVLRTWGVFKTIEAMPMRSPPCRSSRI